MNKTAMIAGLAALILGSLAAFAQSTKPTEMFPFVLPWSDALQGTATDVSFLNTRPAGANGIIVSKDGHFVEANTGKRVRFLGTNFAAKAAFPSHADAVKVAARVAKLGINLVRMHHMDNVDWGQDSSIWDYSYKDRQHISAAQLDKLDYLVAQLKKQGVYVNLNLHVSRQFSEADGFPASVKQIAFGYDKRVDEFDSRMIQLQKKYAHDLLTHVNPYTKLAYASDPAVAMVEINNENSLVGDPWATYGADLQGLPEPYRGELVGLWNGWLTKKYSTEAALTKAWTTGVTPTGPGLLGSNSMWSDEHQGTSDARLDLLQAADGVKAAIPIKAEILKTDGTDWHVQVHQTGLDLTEGATYTVSFRARADSDRPVPVTCGLDQADWHNIGLSATANLGTDWKPFTYSFTAKGVVPNHGRVALVLGGRTGTVWISNLQIHAGADSAGLQRGESLAAGNVGIPESALRTQHDDWIEFLADTERNYADSMRTYIKDELHSRANVICSQVSWGGLTGIRREADMDFADNHAYWQHPRFPGKPWDPENWLIENTAMVSALAKGGGTLPGLAEYRIAGKPYTISEYNHPAPNDYRAECTPILATFAAIQDWDAIYLFDYGDYGTGVQNDKINGYFGISSDPAKTAFLPAAAMMFRETEIPAATAETQEVRISTLKQASGSLWVGKAAMSFYDWAIGVRPMPGDHLQTSARRPMPKTSTKVRTYLETNGSKAMYISKSPDAVCLVGYVGGQQFDADDLTANFPAFGNDFASVTLTTMDRKPIRSSGRMLLTLVGKVENQDMVWNAQRTSVGSHWGHGPTIAEGIPATVTIAAVGTLHVWALDGAGSRIEPVPAKVEGGKLAFTVGPKYHTLWYEITE